MTEKMEFDPGRGEGAGEPKEQEELRQFDDATYEPRAAAEQSGGYREAEAIQSAFESAVENGGEIPGATPLPIPRPAGAADGPLDGKGKRPSSAASPDGEGNDLAAGKAGDIPLAAPQETHERGAASPASAPDGKDAGRATDSSDEVPSAAPRKAVRSTAPGGAPKESVSPVEGEAHENSDKEGNFQIQSLQDRGGDAKSTAASVKDQQKHSDESIIQKAG
jgi:hypothetical protein